MIIVHNFLKTKANKCAPKRLSPFPLCFVILQCSLDMILGIVSAVWVLNKAETVEIFCQYLENLLTLGQ